MPQFELLAGLPADGPMYVPITANGEPFYSEGVVLRMYPAHGEPWVANLKPGLTSFTAAFDVPEHNRVVVIAGGEGYVLDPARQQSLFDFGGQIEQALVVEDQALVFVDLVRLTVLFLRTGELWASERISWDGFREVRTEGLNIHGESWQPDKHDGRWVAFSFNIETRRSSGGSFPMGFGSGPFQHVPNSRCPDLWKL